MNESAIIERKPIWYSYWAILLSLLVVGLGFLGYRYSAGLLTTNMGSIISWGLWISFYILFIGLSAGSFLLSTLIYVFNVKRYERIGRLALYSAAICLIIGILFVSADLGHPERFWKVFTNLASTSVLWFEIMFYIMYVIIIVVELYFLTRTDLIGLREGNTGIKRGFYNLLSLGSQRLDGTSKERDMKWVKILGLIGIPTAIGVHGGTGAVFAVVKAVPHWYNPLLPIVFITSALVSGAALLLFLRTFFFKPEADETPFLSGLAKLALGLLAIDWLLVIFEFLVILYGAIPGTVGSFQEMLFGPNWWIFWIEQVSLGVFVPAYLILFRGKSRISLGLAGLAIMIGISAVRWNIIVPGLTELKLTGLPEAFSSTRLVPLYSPSVVEWISSFGILALFMVLISLGLKLLPLQAATEHEAKPVRRILKW
jgi:molybdopterin-containing oxidoreductase family membrane subunit